MNKREEFDKKFECDLLKITDAEYFDGDEIGDAIYSWHISEQKKLLERVEKEIIGEYEGCQGMDTSKIMNREERDNLDRLVRDAFKSKLLQSLNKLNKHIKTGIQQ